MIHEAYLAKRKALRNQFDSIKTEKNRVNFLEFAISNDPSSDSPEKVHEQAQYVICSEIKRAGKQRNFCEDKFLNSDEGEKVVVGCFTNFCEVCCEPFEHNQCLSLCQKTHIDSSIKNLKDPEEIFIEVCASESMGNSMRPFCDKFYGKSQTALKLCQHSFCYDCCVSELKINDEMDEEVKKCTRVCEEKIRDYKKKEKSHETEEKKEELTTQNQSLQKGKEWKCLISKDENLKFCQEIVDHGSMDYRRVDPETCMKYFCPLCCEKGSTDVGGTLNCQKDCHKTQKETDSAFSFKDDDFQDNPTEQEETLSIDEIHFLSLICNSLKFKSCNNDICNLACLKLWKDEKKIECLDFCNKNIGKNIEDPMNSAVFELIAEFLDQNMLKIYEAKYPNSSTPLGNSEESGFNTSENPIELITSYLNNQTHQNLTESPCNNSKIEPEVAPISEKNQTLDEKMIELEKEIQKEKSELLKLEDRMLGLQHQKTLEIKKSFKFNKLKKAE